MAFPIAASGVIWPESGPKVIWPPPGALTIVRATSAARAPVTSSNVVQKRRTKKRQNPRLMSVSWKVSQKGFGDYMPSMIFSFHGWQQISTHLKNQRRMTPSFRQPQNANRSPICTVRGRFACDVIVPNAPDVGDRFGVPKLG